LADQLPLDRWPEFRRVHDYLAAKAPPGKLPGRQHVDPVDLPDLLPRIMLIDVDRSATTARRYRIRLMGSELVALHGADVTGKYVDQAIRGGKEIIAAYDDIVASRRPQHSEDNVRVAGREFIPYERIAFPLAGDGENVDMLLLIFVPKLPPR